MFSPAGAEFTPHVPYSVSLRLFFKKSPQRQTVPEFKNGFQHPADQPDQGSVDQRAEDRSEFDAFKMAEAEKDEGEDHTGQAGTAVIDRLCFADVKAVIGRDLLHEKFI